MRPSDHRSHAHRPESFAKTPPAVIAAVLDQDGDPAAEMSVGRPAADEPATPKPRSGPHALAEAVETALAGIDVLDHHARRIARIFRDGRVAEARLGLADLIETTQTMLRLAATAADAAGQDLMTAGDLHGRQLADDTRAVVDALIDAQMAGAWDRLASTLDGDFTSVLGGWRAVFEWLAAFGGPHPGGRAA